EISRFTDKYNQPGQTTMRYTTDERGILNNYAAEPAVYVAESPSPEQQRRYAFQGAIAILFVTLLVLTALGVSY
ncbi:MAG: ssl1498 family light-harvesting-like protein, partial [Cyanobacteriota bacterium]